MSSKRKDIRGRLLRIGEDQLQDGRYRFRYTAKNKQRCAVYSWRLTDADAVPNGKKECTSLRHKEQQIRMDISDGIDSRSAETVTLKDLFFIYMEGRTELKPSTRANYRNIYDTYLKDDFGNMPVGEIDYLIVKRFYTNAVTKGITYRSKKTGRKRKSCPLKLGSLKMIHAVLKPLLSIAVRKGYVRINPCPEAFSETRRMYVIEKEKKHALTELQQEKLLEHTAASERYSKWLPLITVFLGTGCRIGEIVGLRWADINFKEQTISINHSLLYRRFEQGKCGPMISSPKTFSGIRTIPMLSAVKRALLAEKMRQRKSGRCPDAVDGYKNFVFQNSKGHLHNSSTLNRLFERLRLECNKKEAVLAEKEGRRPVLIPHFTAHSLRHTFCTRFCENESNIKVIQNIMGHADIRTTMNIYAEVTEKKKKETMEALEGKMGIV